MLVEATIDPRRVNFIRLDERRAARLAIGLFCGDRKQAEAVCESWQEMNLALTEVTYYRFVREGIPCKVRIPATRAPRYVKVVVFDYRFGNVGAMTAKVR